MKVAVFTPYPPTPLNAGGRLRTHHLAKAVSQKAEVHLFSQGHLPDLDTPEHRAALSPYASVTIVPSGLLLSPTLPKRVERCGPRALKRAFQKEDRRAPFDLLWVEQVHAARIAAGTKRPWLLDEHNIESAYLRAKLEAARPLTRTDRREIHRLERWEQTQWKDAAQLVAVTPGDAEHMSAFRGTPPEMIPNGVDLMQLNFRSPSERTGKDVLFVGLMSHPPNIEAGQYLIREVMPQVWPHHPDARLVLCGAEPTDTVKSWASSRVLVTGTVPSVAPYLSKARVSALALQQGAGSSLKVVEALAAGLPLVATSVAVRGFPLEPETHYLHADNPADIAHHITRQLEYDPDAPARAERGRNIATTYDWTALGRQFSKILFSIVQTTFD